MSMTMQTASLARRSVLFAAAASGLLAASSRVIAGGADANFVNSPFRHISPAEWRKRLSPASFGVLREEDTEYPNSSALLNEHRRGTFICMGCDLPLFKSEWKYDSGTGWPSFFRALDTGIQRKTDFKIGIPRTEYHCARCLGHQGHVFDDGPQPTGLRYCNNGVALKFVAA
jgi:peptide-methionine (R)-S-oxide reductase